MVKRHAPRPSLQLGAQPCHKRLLSRKIERLACDGQQLLFPASCLDQRFGNGASSGSSSNRTSTLGLSTASAQYRTGPRFNNGSIFVNALVPKGVPDPENALHQLTDALLLTAAAAARAGVNDGTYAAALIIPPDFSANLTISAARPDLLPVAVEVYASPAAPVSGSVVSSI